MSISGTFFSRRAGGFSLVEVVLALAVVAFALVAMLCLLSAGVTSGRQAADDTLLASMASTVEARLRTDAELNLANMTAPQARVFWFNVSGSPLADAGGALYRCDASRRDVSAEIPDTGAGFALLTLTFRWPVGAPEANQTREVLHVTLRK